MAKRTQSNDDICGDAKRICADSREETRQEDVAGPASDAADPLHISDSASGLDVNPPSEIANAEAANDAGDPLHMSDSASGIDVEPQSETAKAEPASDAGDPVHISDSDSALNVKPPSEIAQPLEESDLIVKSPEESNMWPCVACTFLNREQLFACEMCGTQRPSSSSEEEEETEEETKEEAEEEEEKEEDGRCPAGHELKEFITPRDSFSCDRCDNVFPSGTKLWSCRQCNYDVCGNCRAKSEESSGEADLNDGTVFEIELETGWTPLDLELVRVLLHAKKKGAKLLQYAARGQIYLVDLQKMLQVNRRTGVARAIRQATADADAGAAADNDADADNDEGAPDLDTVPGLRELQELLLKPPPPPPSVPREQPKLEAQQIRDTILSLVPEAKSLIAPRSNGTPALEFLVKSYENGLPAFPPVVSEHLREGVRLLIGALHEPSSARLTQSRCKSLAERLVDSFANCQAVQARTIDTLQADLRGVASHNLPAQIRSFAEEYREMALDRTVCHFHPRAPVMQDSKPQEQLPHLANRYRRHLGNEAGFSGPRLEAAKQDRNAQGPLPVPRKRTLLRFLREFSPLEFVDAVVADVNQSESDAQRRIDVDLLMKWAGSNPSVGYRIFYDESQSELYAGLTPSEQQLGLRQPTLYRALAVQILLVALQEGTETTGTETAATADAT